MNRWKTAFWVCFIVLLAVTCISLYSILDQGVSLTHMRQSYDDKENDLKTLSYIINETDLSKPQIKAFLAQQNISSYTHLSKDTLSVNYLTLIFKGNKLRKVIPK